MDVSFMERFLPMYVTAAQLTLTIAVIGIAISVVIGIAASLALYYRIPGLRQLVAVYVELSRNTPLLVQLFFLYFGLPKIGIRLSPEICAGQRPCAMSSCRRQWRSRCRLSSQI